MRIIFINRFFYPDHSATSQMLSDLAFALAERGHDVRVVTSRLTYDGQVEPLPSRERHRGVDIVRLATSRFGRDGLMGRMVDYFTFYAATAAHLVRHVRRGDLVVAKTDPPMLSLITAPVAALKGAHSVNWLQDVFPEVATAVGIARSGFAGLAIRGLRWLRNVTLRNAHVNVVLGRRMAEKVAAMGVRRRRIRIIPNWADGQLIRPIDRRENPLRREWSCEDAFVVSYSGNLGRAHDIDTFIDAITRVEQLATPEMETVGARVARTIAAAPQHALVAMPLPRVRWLFIGGGAMTKRLQDEVARRGLTSVEFRPYQPRERLSQSLSVADIHLVSLRPELEGLIVPSKYYGIAAAGRPAIFIGDPDGEIAAILRQTETGYCVAEGDSTALATLVQRLAGEPERIAQQGRRARRLFEKRYDLRHAVEAWEAVLYEASQ